MIRQLVISSLSNSVIKTVSSLHHKKGRTEQKLFIAEGIHLVQEALRAKADIRFFLWSAKLLASTEGQAVYQELRENYQGYEITEIVLGKVAETENPQGVLAIIAIPDYSVMDLATIELGIIIDGLQDPGNVGTIIRTGWAVGCAPLIFTKGTVDPYQGKVVRASMGGIFHQKILLNYDPVSIAELAKKFSLQIVAGDLSANQSYFGSDLRKPTLILIGNEGRGISPGWDIFPIKRVLIPQPGGANSLNASVSAGILAYEALRQRTMMDTCKS